MPKLGMEPVRRRQIIAAARICLTREGLAHASVGAIARQAGVAPALSGHSDQQRYLEGKALATQITAQLGLRGFRLNLSIESAANLKELIELLPKIQAAAGADHCKELEAALRG